MEMTVVSGHMCIPVRFLDVTSMGQGQPQLRSSELGNQSPEKHLLMVLGTSVRSCHLSLSLKCLQDLNLLKPGLGKVHQSEPGVIGV